MVLHCSHVLEQQPTVSINCVHNIMQQTDDYLSHLNQGMLLAWAMKPQRLWEAGDDFVKGLRDILSAVVPQQQPRWVKGAAIVMFTYALVT